MAKHIWIYFSIQASSKWHRKFHFCTCIDFDFMKKIKELYKKFFPLLCGCVAIHCDYFNLYHCVFNIPLNGDY